jgi:hypothetical protein
VPDIGQAATHGELPATEERPFDMFVRSALLRRILPLALAAGTPLGAIVACSSDDTGGTGCSKDSDCKGDRICSAEGQCVETTTSSSSSTGASGGSGGGASATASNGASSAGSGMTCEGGKALCEGTCVDTLSDAKHCGGCGKPCSAGQVCSGGACKLNCDQGLTVCGNDCVDILSDAKHCGGCGKACEPGATCASAVCKSKDVCDLLTFEGHAYRFCMTADGGGKAAALSWPDAEADCVAHGGHLVTINTASEWSFVNDILNAKYTYFDTSIPWIGYSDQAQEGKFVWVSGQAGYDKWQNGEPQGGTGENCVDFNNGGSQGYRDNFCSVKKSYICEQN